MRRILVALLVVCVVSSVVAVAFGQGRGNQPRGRGQMQMPATMSSVIAGDKIFVLKENVIYKVSATSLKVEKKNKLDLPQDEGQMGRFSRMLGGQTLKVEGKNLFLLGRTAIHKVNIDSLELAGTLKVGDLTPPEEEKKEGEEEEEKKGGGGDF